MINQKKIGNKYEFKLCSILKDSKYWCHLFEYSVNGQPCDIVAIKDDVSFLIDVKHCEGDRFYTSRIEPNQQSCFNYAKKCGIKNVGFAIYFEKSKCWKWLEYDEKIINISSIRKDELKNLEAVLCL